MTPPSTSSQRRQRLSDPAALDAQLLRANALAFDKQSGEFSGWLHVADVTQLRKRRAPELQQRFCRLRELECAFYETSKAKAPPFTTHVIVAVARVHERNKTLLLTDHADRRLLLHSALGADFEQWFDAFAGAVRSTRVAKSPIEAQEAQRRELGLELGFGLDQRCRVPTAASDAHDELDERTRAVWLYLHSPWWTLRRRRARRYLVLSGVTLSCFRVNKEGYVADFVVRLAGCEFDRERNPREVRVISESGKMLRLSAPAKARSLEAWVAHLQSVLAAARRAYSEVELVEQQPPILGGFV